CMAANSPFALATVVETWVAAARGVGSKMAGTADMAMIGPVSGGCVETAVIEEALESLQSGKPRLLHFGVSDDTAWDVGLTCGGRISVCGEPVEGRWWSVVGDAARSARLATPATLL